MLRPGDGPMVIFEGVTKRYDQNVLGLDDVSLSIESGEFVFLVGPSGLGQVDVHPPADQGVRPHRGDDHGGRPQPEPPAPLEGALPAPRHRLRLPGLQAAGRPHGLRQRGLRAPGDRREPAQHPAQGAGDPRPGGPGGQGRPLPQRAVGRRAAARLDRAGVRQPPAPADRRRADREPRPRDLDRDHAAALPHQPHRHDGHHGHARPRDGRQDADAGDRARGRPASCATSARAATPASTTTTRGA